jgi:hypothetical protein
MMTMAEAPPGVEPQTAVVPGKTCQRVSSQPRPAAMAITETMKTKKSGASLADGERQHDGRDHRADQQRGGQREEFEEKDENGRQGEQQCPFGQARFLMEAACVQNCDPRTFRPERARRRRWEEAPAV